MRWMRRRRGTSRRGMGSAIGVLDEVFHPGGRQARELMEVPHEQILPALQLISRVRPPSIAPPSRGSDARRQNARSGGTIVRGVSRGAAIADHGVVHTDELDVGGVSGADVEVLGL